ncbi:MAG: hypothetical protein HYX90_10925 [Chloroflexi bacterium]|nr:hypothetical protein [Chloroflexota bacterium]
MFQSHLKVWLKVGGMTAGLLLLVAACSSSPQATASATVAPIPRALSSSSVAGRVPTNGLVQTTDLGEVTIAVEWGGLKDGQLAFGVTLDTHSGSIDRYDLGKLAVLRDAGGKEYRPSQWNSPGGGHHGKGLLVFPAGSIDPATSKVVVMVIRDTTGKERNLRWQFS